MHQSIASGGGTSVAPPRAVLRSRPTRIRCLSFHRTPPAGLAEVNLGPLFDGELDPPVHARSQFRSVDDPDLFAVYAVHELGSTVPGTSGGALDHTLIVVREFRRVPLDASALALALFRARGGYAARAIAALAHWAERAVSLCEPSYLLVAHSLEDPRLIALLTGVHECRALVGSQSSAFSVASLLTETGPLLSGEPEWFAYCAPEHADTPLISPSAV
jgi:hypothetical protein